MLQNGLELIVQYPDRGDYACRGFRGLKLAFPVYVVFDGSSVSDQGVANQLGMAFCDELNRYVGSTESSVPCNGHQPLAKCHALDVTNCRKILVRPSASPPQSSSWIAPSAEPIWLRDWPKENWQVIPVMPAGTSPSAYLPTEWQGINASFWTQNPSESLWAIMQRAGLVPDESRIFISYVRRDTTPIADQLFAALTEEGFDVFLDRASVPVGVEFQERLMQDLVDKAMVVFLNSASVAQSKWVGEEIATIKKYRLGLLEVRYPGGLQRPDIDSDFTYIVNQSDLVPAGTSYAPPAQELSPAALKEIVQRIKETHGRALHRRRYELIDNFAAALAAAGKTAQVLTDGTFVLPPRGSQPGAVVGLMTRIPELGDFCSLHLRGGVSSSRVGWLISPSPFFVSQRQAHVTWLGGISNIKHADEAQIAQLAATL